MGSFLNKTFNFLSVELTVMLTAALLDMRFKWTFPAIFAGNLIAGILVMALSNGVVRAFS